MTKYISGIVIDPIDIEENWYKFDPPTIPGVKYISSDRNNFKIGNGRNWSKIDYAGTNSIPVGTLLYNIFKTTPDGFCKLSGELLQKSKYRRLFDHAVINKMIIDDNVWLSDPSKQGYFSYGPDNGINYRLPKIDNMLLRTWIEGCDRSKSVVPGEYQHGTLISTDITNTGKLLYGIQLKDVINVAVDMGIDQPLCKINGTTTGVSGIIESPTKKGSVIGTMRPETLSYPLYIKY